MKDTGKEFKGVPIFTDSEVPPNQILLLNNLPPRRNATTSPIDVDPENVGFKDIHYNGKPVTRDGLRDDTKQPEGYKAKSFKGIPVAVEWHKDGSVALAKEVVEQIRATGDMSLLIPPPPGTMYLMNGRGTQDDPS